MGRRRVHREFWWGDLRKVNPVVDGRIILKWIFKTWDGEHGLDLSVSG
jgi:hypothetical protein